MLHHSSYVEEQPSDKNKRQQIRQIITLKTNVEYDDSTIKMPIAKRLVAEAERIFDWTKKHLA